MKTYEEVATAAGLDEKTSQRFIRYMTTRWADGETINCLSGYASEWAQRFKKGIEFSASDLEGQAILRAMQP